MAELVRMHRDPALGEPRVADVHPDEVAKWEARGWVVGDAPPPEGKTITGLANTDWDPANVRDDRAATEGQLAALALGGGSAVDLSGFAKRAELATVATSGDYADLANRPAIPAAYDDAALVARVAAVEGRADIKSIGAGLSLSGAGELSAAGGGASGGSSITVDDSLDGSSLNPVQNRVILGAFESWSGAMQRTDGRVSANEAAIGALADLTTTDKTSLVKAANEIRATAVQADQLLGQEITAIQNAGYQTAAQVEAALAAFFVIKGTSKDNIDVAAGARVNSQIQIIAADEERQIAGFKRVFIENATSNGANRDAIALQSMATGGGGKQAQIAVLNTGDAAARIKISVECFCIAGTLQ